MKFITCPKPNVYHLFFLGYFLIRIPREYLNEALFGNSKHKSGHLYRMYVYILSLLLSFIPYFISIYLSKRKAKINSNITLYKMYTNKSEIKTHEGINLFKQILIVSLFGFSAEAVFYIIFLINNVQKAVSSYSLGIYLVLNTVLIYAASYCVLKTYFYKHHYLSLFINTICFLVSLVGDIITIVNLNIKEVNYYIYIVIRIVRLILLCFLYCYSKKVLNSAFLSPYSIIAFEAIYENIFLIFFTIPLIFIPIKEFNNEKDIIFKSFLNYLKGINILYSILLLINDYLIVLFRMFIIYKFSPSHFTLALILESFTHMGYKIINNIVLKKNVYWTQYANLGIYFVLFIGSMIHNEIFIINRCELNTKTQLYLDSEFNGEISSIEDINSNSNDDESKDSKESKDQKEMVIFV